MSRSTNPLQRVTAGLTAGLLVISQLSFPPRAEAALGSSTASAGSALPPSMTAIESFQPDLFTGRATTSIPIAIAPGRKGVQPGLALTYSSSARNGLVGVGWSFDVGYIERSTKLGVPKYNSSDTFTFMLQGVNSDLVQVTDGSYRAKDEGLFLRFQNDGVSGWEARDKSGTRYLFGQTTASQIEDGGGRVFRWSIDKVIDTQGNTMTYVYYAKDADRQLYLGRIEYAGYEGTGPSFRTPNEVSFHWESRLDIETNYRSGFEVKTSQRLSSIEPKAAVGAVEQLVRRYALNYDYSARTGRSLLKSIRQFGADNATALPATTFTYQEQAPAYTLTSNNSAVSVVGWNVRKAALDTGHDNFGCVNPYAGLPWGASQVVSSSADLSCMTASVGGNGSVTMNGCQDHFGHAYVYVYNNTARTLSVPVSPISDVDGCVWREDGAGVQNMGAGGSVPVQAGWTILHITAYHQHAGWGITMPASLASQVTLMSPTQSLAPQLAGDFDGNGITDLAKFSPSSSSSQWTISLSHNGIFAPEATWLSGGFGNTSSVPLVGDWNGDGRTDIGRYEDAAWTFAISTANAFQPNTPALLYAYAAGIPFTGDFNGDGIVDVGAYTPNTPVKWSIALGTGSSFVPTSPFNHTLGTSTATPLTGDFNGDGLTDIATVENGTVSVALSNGGSFESPAPWLTGFSGGNYTSADFNGDGLTDVGRYDQAAGRIYVAQSSGRQFKIPELLPPTFSLRSTDDHIQIGDFNGDGLADPAIFNASASSSQMANSQGSFPDLLATVSNGLGGSTGITYRSSAQCENDCPIQHVPLLPFVLPLVQRVTAQDGLGNSYQSTYQFKGGRYDPLTKEFRGFSRAEVRDSDTNLSVTEFYQDDIKKGRPFHTEFQDAAGHLWTKSEQTWIDTELFPGVRFVKLDTSESWTCDGDLACRSVRSHFTYDQYGNVTRADEEGEVGVTGDERSTATTYVLNDSPSVWILNKPQLTQTLKADGVTVVAKRQFYYDGAAATTTLPTKGNLTKEEEWLNPGNRWLATALTYDPYGNVLTVKDALNRQTTNEYDTDKIYLTRITNHLGHTRELTYDPRFGQVTSSKDQNGVESRTAYDTLGRPIQTSFINPATSAETILSHTIYDSCFTNTACTPPYRIDTIVYAQPGELSRMDTRQYFDGLGHTIQSISPAEDPTKEIVSGVVEFNNRGQVSKQWVPYLQTDLDQYQSPPVASLAAPVEYAYDPMGRLLRSTNPDGSITQTAYDDWTVTSTDANGNVTRRFNDAYGRLIKVEEVDGSNIYGTTYAYDTLNNLTQVTDQLGNITSITYDSLGRKLSMNDPDMGIWSYTYDDVDNLKTQRDARQVVTNFNYDALNRVFEKFYTIPAGSGIPTPGAVTYTYDGANDLSKPFTKGKLTKVLDGSGNSTFEYDNLGRLIKETKTVNGDAAYTIQRSYDLLGRLVSLTYPDTEAANYTYNAQGGIETVALGSQSIISGMVYNAAGQVTQITYGNGVTSTYGYDLETLRLKTLKSVGPSGTLQDYTYTFDQVGNVTGITDAVHTASQNFIYDNLHRLTQAQGAYGTLNYEYDPIGNLLTKEGVTMTYGASAAGPHAVTGLGDSTALTYDLNGNLKQKTKGSATLATYTWDAENRLTQVQQVPPETTVQVNLQQGWNFFALPVELSPNATVDTTGIAQVSRYNNGVWEHWVNDPDFNDFELWELEPGVGYQVYCTSAVPLNLTGKPISNLSKPLGTGWHLLGATNTTGTLTPTGWLSGVTASQVQKLADSTGTLATATQIDPGQAYWIQLGTGGTWTPPAPPQQTTTFAYDGDGGRVKQTVGGQTTIYLGETYDKTGSTTTKYVFAGSQRIAAKDSTGLRFYHSDHLGSSNIITNGIGQLVELNENTPFGGLSRHEGTTNVPHKFTGQRLDQTALYFYQARYYDPVLGRFLSPDPFVQGPDDPQSLNRYSYCRNNPINLVDPSGYKWSWKAFFGIVAIVAAVIVTAGVAAPAIAGAAGLAGGAIEAGVGAAAAAAYSAIPYAAATALASGTAFAFTPGNTSPGFATAVGIATTIGGSFIGVGGLSASGMLAQVGRNLATGAAVGGILDTSVAEAAAANLTGYLEDMGMPHWVARLTVGVMAVTVVNAFASKGFTATRTLPRGAINAPISLTKEGEAFIRVGSNPRNLKYSFEKSGGMLPQTYAFPEEQFLKFNNNPLTIKYLGDLPELPTVYGRFTPPAGTRIKRGIVPGGKHGGAGGVEEVYFPDGF